MATASADPRAHHESATGVHDLAPVFEGVRVVAFDLDNTLVDLVRVKARAAEAAAWALADAGLDVDPAEAAEEIAATGLEVGIDRDDVVDEYLARRLGRPDARLVAVGRHAFERAEDANAVPYPRAHRTLIELVRRGYRLVVVTDAPRRRALARLQASRLLPFFPDVVTLEDTPHGKADERPYALVGERLAVPPGAVLMVGDNPARDVGSARAHGCRAVLAAYGLQPHFASALPEHRPDHVIGWLDDLLRFLPGPSREERAPNGNGNALTAERPRGT